MLATAPELVLETRLFDDAPIPLSQLAAALSTALDLTEGQPENHAVRSCHIALRIAEIVGLSAEDRAALYYAVLLKDLGCSSNAAKLCYLFGADDRTVKGDLKTVNWSRLTSKFRFALGHIAPGESPMQKVLKLVAMARQGEAGEKKLVEIRCERGAEIARMVGLPEAAAQAIRHLDEHWDGSGHPVGVKGHEIPLLARIAGLAQTVEVFTTAHGPAAARNMATARRGTWFDPALVDAFQSISRCDPVWKDAYGLDPRGALRSLAPPEAFADTIGDGADAQLDRVCLGFARVVDAKSPWTCKHSERVAELARGVTRELGGDLDAQRDLHRAGLLHDLGKLGVSNLILDKPGKPTDSEFDEIRKHPDYSEQILRRVTGFERFADVASAHHERLDGRGYHRRLPGTVLSPAARILSVADVYEALTADRPYRSGFPRDKAMEIMRRDVGTAFCPVSFEALERLVEKIEFTPRVEAQLAAIEAAYSG